MLFLHGAGIGKGIAIGPAFILPRSQLEVPQYQIETDKIEDEVWRFSDAIATARGQLEDVAMDIPEDAPPESRSFIDTHLLMLNDPMIVEQPIQSIREQQCNAEWALHIHGQTLTAAFDKMQDAYLREKKNDVRHIINRIQRILLNVQEQSLENISIDLRDRIVVSHELSPADTVLLENQNIAAFVTDLGGPISHTAILARSLKIPAVLGLHGATRYVRHGETIIVDGKRGAIVVGPDRWVLNLFRERQAYITARRHSLDDIKSKDPVTRDGCNITLLANVELSVDIDEAHTANAQGVGLYRTEYLFVNQPDPPSEEEQYIAYADVVRRINKSVTIRTLDLGADKQVDGGRNEAPTNPALGLRGIRLCLNEPRLFRPQLRAVLRASALGPTQIMIPMVSALPELDQVLDLISEVKVELTREGIEYDRKIPVGGMIEVPAAAIAADMFAYKLDFLSIGTNDLIQYALAIDRIDDAVNYLYDPLHPSVLRLIKTTIDAGDRAGIPVAMCGEMAGDARYTKLLLAMGLKIFSMDPTALLEVKKKVLESDLPALSRKVPEILHCADINRMHDLVVQLEKL